MWQESPIHEGKEGLRALTKEGSVREVMKDLEGQKAQKEGRWKKEVKRMKTQAWAIDGHPSCRKWVLGEKAWKCKEGYGKGRR